MQEQTPIPNQNQPMPVTPMESTVQPRKKQFHWIVLGILVSLVIAALFVPIPYYESREVVCKPNQTNCPKPGWRLNPSLFQSLLAAYQQPNRSQATSLVSPTPSPTPNPTANWQTYTDETFKFSFMHPKDYTVVAQSEAILSKESNINLPQGFQNFMGYPSPKVLYAVKLKLKSAPSGPYREPIVFSLWIFDNPRQYSIDEWSEKYNYYPQNWGKSANPDEFKAVYETTIGGIPGKFGYAFGMSKSKGIFLALQQQIWLLIAQADIDPAQQRELPSTSIANQILSTFQFTQ